MLHSSFTPRVVAESVNGSFSIQLDSMVGLHKWKAEFSDGNIDELTEQVWHRLLIPVGVPTTHGTVFITLIRKVLGM